jgi:uncharacterized protein YuzE
MLDVTGHWVLDAAANAAWLRLSNSPVAESEEVRPDVVFDFDAAGRIVRIEVLDAQALLPDTIIGAVAAE